MSHGHDQSVVSITSDKTRLAYAHQLAMALVLDGAVAFVPAHAADQPVSASRLHLQDKRKLRRGVARTARTLVLESCDASRKAARVRAMQRIEETLFALAEAG